MKMDKIALFGLANLENTHHSGDVVPYFVETRYAIYWAAFM